MNYKLLIIQSKFNSLITNNLRDGAVEELRSLGLDKDDIETVTVPGCFELPVTAVRAARTKKYDGIITLGCVIRGETPHFDFVAGEAARGVMNCATEYGIPVSFGVLTTDNEQQALNRIGLKGGNKGAEAARAVIDTLRAIEQFGDS